MLLGGGTETVTQTSRLESRGARKTFLCSPFRYLTRYSFEYLWKRTGATTARLLEGSEPRGWESALRVSHRARYLRTIPP